jgi:mono/diheme cytochrome c family protein
VKRGVSFALVAVAVLGLRLYARPPAPTIVPFHGSVVATTAEARGRLVFERYGCRACHGEEGQGGLANPNAQGGKVPSVVIDYAGEGYSVAELKRLIVSGKPRIDRDDPKGPIPPYRMPGWKGQITERETDDLVRYLLGLYPGSQAKKSHPAQ